MSNLSAELPGKRLEILKETVPQSARVAVLANKANPNHASAMHNLTEAAQALGLHLHVVELRRPDELDAAFAAMTRAGADAVIVMEDAMLLNSQRGRVVADLAAKHRLPVMFPPGCARLATNPCPTGSEVAAITIGIVRVACWAARIAVAPTATITSILSRTSSAARSRRRSSLPSA